MIFELLRPIRQRDIYAVCRHKELFEPASARFHRQTKPKSCVYDIERKIDNNNNKNSRN